MVVSLLAFVTVRPFVMRHFYNRSQTVPTNVSAMAGKEGVVIAAFDPVTHEGRVKVGGEDWRGVSPDGLALAEGARVRVTRVEGTRLFVAPQ